MCPQIHFEFSFSEATPEQNPTHSNASRRVEVRSLLKVHEEVECDVIHNHIDKYLISKS